jgi:protein-L-isoaspartate(D-aspartate) O-methyltransferase
MNTERARFNMVEQQIRTWEVLDTRILDLLYVVRREEFVPQAWRSLAFSDLEIPLFEGAGPGECMMPPRVEARLLQELALEPQAKVLEIGTGSGYLTALLAARAARVVSIEINPQIAQAGAANLARAGVTNVTLEVGNGLEGVLHQAPYDAIVLTGSVPAVPQVLIEQLMPGGRLFAVTGRSPVMRAQLITRLGAGSTSSVDLFDTDLAPLSQAIEPSRFRF